MSLRTYQRVFQTRNVANDAYVQGLLWSPDLEGQVSPYYDFNDTLFARTPEFQAYLTLLERIGDAKLQMDNSWYNDGRNFY